MPQKFMNLSKRDSGSIHIFGKENNGADEKWIKDKIGFVYDQSYFYEELSVRDNARIIAPFYRQWNEKTFHGYLDRFGIIPKEKVKNLSKGMKTKFALAVALSHGAGLLIMDEPTSGLDPIFRRELLHMMQDMIRDGKTSVLFSTHITADLEKIADQITFIHDGQLVFSREKDEVLEKYRLVKGGQEELSSSLKEACIGMKTNSYGFEALMERNKQPKAGENLIFERPSLEDIMYYITRGDRR